MMNSNQTIQADHPKKKMTLQDAIIRQLANKKIKLASGYLIGRSLQSSKKMKSRPSNKVMNQSRGVGAE